MKRKHLLAALLALSATMGLASCDLFRPSTSSQPGPSSSSTPAPSTSSAAPSTSSVAPSTSSAAPSTSSSSAVQLVHKPAFVSEIESGASLRTYNELFDGKVNDFSSATLEGTLTDGDHLKSGKLRVLVDNEADGYPNTPDAAIYKMATGTHLIHDFEGIGFKIRKVGEGKLNLEDLVLALRGNDAWDVYELNLAEAVNPDGEPLEELSDEWQNLVVSHKLSIEDDTTEYKLKGTDTNSGTKVLETILGFHLYAKSGSNVSQIIEIEEVFLQNAGEATIVDSFDREKTNQTDNTVWWRDSTGFIVQDGVSLKDGASYQTDITLGDYENVAININGDTSGTSIAPVTAAGVGTAVKWSDLKDQNNAPVVNAVNGSYNSFVINLANSGISKEGLLGLKISSTSEVNVTDIFLTNLGEKVALVDYPILDTANAAVFDHFTRNQTKLDDNYDSAAANTVVTDSGLNFSIAYNGAQNTSVNGDALTIVGIESPGYVQVTEGSKTPRTNEKYMVFAMKLEDGANLNEFRIASSASGVKYANQWLAGPGLKSVPEDLAAYPYIDADGYVYYIIDLEETGFQVTDLFDMYYTGPGKVMIDSIFFANPYEGVAEVVSRGDAQDFAVGGGYSYVYGGQIANSSKMAIYLQGDGTATLGSFRLEYNSKTLWLKDGALAVYKEDGTKVTASEVIPTEETKYIVDLVESGYTIKEEADHVHLHFGDLAGDPAGTIKLIKTTAYAPSAYEENWGNPGEIVLEGGYKYAYGGYSTGNCERIELTLKGDGTVALDSFRLQLEGYETIWVKDGVLKLYNADGTVFDYSQALPTGDVKLYIDLKEAGFTTGNACHMHLHFGDLPGATTGKIVISSIKGVSETPSYKAVMGNYVEYVAPQPAE